MSFKEGKPNQLDIAARVIGFFRHPGIIRRSSNPLHSPGIVAGGGEVVVNGSNITKDKPTETDSLKTSK